MMSKKGCYSYRQPGNVYKGEGFMFDEISPGGFKKIAEHKQTIWVRFLLHNPGQGCILLIYRFL